VGVDEERRELVVGLIDYMRQYDIIKKMERMGKSVGMIAGQVGAITHVEIYTRLWHRACQASSFL
jgi:hypothetical protein